MQKGAIAKKYPVGASAAESCRSIIAVEFCLRLSLRCGVKAPQRADVKTGLQTWIQAAASVFGTTSMNLRFCAPRVLNATVPSTVAKIV